MTDWKKIGEGDEAYALSGIIDLSEISGGILSGDAEVVKRVEWTPNEYSAYSTFLKNLAAYLFDVYFRHKGVYVHQHISQPIGISEPDWACIYEYFRGSEGFPWSLMTEHGEERIELGEWNAFVSYFITAGINVGIDVADPDDARVSKNIILKGRYDIGTLYSTLRLPPDWRRIDFGSRSCLFKHDRFYEFIKPKEGDLRNLFGNAAALLYSIHEYAAGRHDGSDIIRMYHKELSSGINMRCSFQF